MENKAKLIKLGLVAYTVGVVMVAVLAQYSVLGNTQPVVGAFCTDECKASCRAGCDAGPEEHRAACNAGCGGACDSRCAQGNGDYTANCPNGDCGLCGAGNSNCDSGHPNYGHNGENPNPGNNNGGGTTNPPAVNTGPGNAQGLAYVGDSCNTDADCFSGLMCGSCGGFTTGGTGTVKKCINGISQNSALIGCMQPGRTPVVDATTANCEGVGAWQIRCRNDGTTVGQQCRPGVGLVDVRADACGASCSNGIIQAAGRACSSTTVGGVTYSYVTQSGFLGCGDVVVNDPARACENCYLNNGQVSCRFEGASCGAKVGCGLGGVVTTPAVTQPGPVVEYAGQPAPEDNPQTPPPSNPPCQAGCTPGLNVDKAVMGSANYTVGSLVNFSITITNTGDQPFNTVAFADTYSPAYLDFTGITGMRTGTGSVNLTSVATVNEAAGTINFANLVPSLGALAPGQSYTLTASFIARAPISITCNYVSITTGGGPTGGDNACVGVTTPDTDI